MKNKTNISDFKIGLVAVAARTGLGMIYIPFAGIAIQRFISLLLLLLIVVHFNLPDTQIVLGSVTHDSVLNPSFALATITLGFLLIFLIISPIFFNETYNYG